MSTENAETSTPVHARGSLSREQVAKILAKLARAEAVADKRDEECVENDHQAAARYFRGQGNGLFRAACLIRETMDEG